MISAPADELAARVDLSGYDAAVVMSHHLQADLHYLRQLAVSSIPYVGLLGPHERRRRLAAELGALACETLGSIARSGWPRHRCAYT